MVNLIEGSLIDFSSSNITIIGNTYHRFLSSHLSPNLCMNLHLASVTENNRMLLTVSARRNTLTATEVTYKAQRKNNNIVISCSEFGKIKQISTISV